VSNAAPIDYRGALEALDRILNRGGDPHQVLGAALMALHARGVASARLRLAENGRLRDSLSVGDETEGIVSPIVHEGVEVASLELAVGDVAFADRVATLISLDVIRLAAAGDHGW
jgi:hypothetical protein